MSAKVAAWRTSSVLLALAGIIVAGIGIYFITLRPPLLPEDVRYMRLSAAEQLAIEPRLATWLTQLFRVLGGYSLATGLLAVTLAATAFRARQSVAVIGAFLGGLASIGLMTAVNFAIDSAFKWLLLGIALIWALSLIAFWIETRAPRAALQISPPHKGNLP